MRLAEHFFANLKRLAVYSLRVGILALAIKHFSEVAYSYKRVRVRLAEHLFANLERLAVYSLRVSVLALAVEHFSEVAYNCKR